MRISKLRVGKHFIHMDLQEEESRQTPFNSSVMSWMHAHQGNQVTLPGRGKCSKKRREGEVKSICWERINHLEQRMRNWTNFSEHIFPTLAKHLYWREKTEHAAGASFLPCIAWCELQVCQVDTGRARGLPEVSEVGILFLFLFFTFVTMNTICTDFVPFAFH